MRDAMASFVYVMAPLHCLIVQVWTVFPACCAPLSYDQQDGYQELKFAPSLLVRSHRVLDVLYVPDSCSFGVDRLQGFNLIGLGNLLVGWPYRS